jgi:hypothetical protein
MHYVANDNEEPGRARPIYTILIAIGVWVFVLLMATGTWRMMTH